MNKYSEMSDLEFVELLESKLEGATWTVGEIVELERRGIEIASPNPSLSHALLKKRSEFTASISKALEPYSRSFELLSNSVNSIKNLQLAKALVWNPRIENQLISSPKTSQDLVLAEFTSILELSLMELRGIRQQNVRDWFQWTILISSVVGALTALFSMIFS